MLTGDPPATADRSDALIVRWDPEGRAPRRIVFEPTRDGWDRSEQAWSDHDGWREVGRERVDSVRIEGYE